MLPGRHAAPRKKSRLTQGIIGYLATAVFASSAFAAPPPQAMVITSGQSVLEGSLSGTILLPDGEIVTQDLMLLLGPHVLRKSDMLLWDVASGTVRILNGERMFLPYGWAGAYRSDIGRLEPTPILFSQDGVLASTTLRLPNDQPTIDEWLTEPGTIVVFNPAIGLPEPGLVEGIGSLILGFAFLARARRLKRAPRGA